MELLSMGTPLSWEETKYYANHVRHHGIEQFINVFHKNKDRTNDCLYFGDEVEYTFVKFDDANRTARVCLKAQYYLEKLAEMERTGMGCKDADWAHEYSSYVIEGMPGKPFGALSSHFKAVEDNMNRRRNHIQSLLENSDEAVLSITSFPRLGCPSFTYPRDPLYLHLAYQAQGRSLFWPDEAINNTRQKFKALTRNIPERRGKKVDINAPIFVDVNTPQPWIEDLPTEASTDAKPNHIYMDTVGFGLGMSCLQVTIQASNLLEARHLYDQLTPLTPILMALSASSPIYRGYLADIDHRWSVISASVDDRTAEEKGEVPLKTDRFMINKSRYDSIDSYLSTEGSKYNDIPLVYDQEIFQRLRDGGIDDLLAKHFAHLFIRDPISLFKEKLTSDDENETDHFENIQSTNWQNMRFKPPPANSQIGWRVEFRPTECQLTDFENAAFTVFVVMLTRVILSYNLNMLIPISKVDENIKRAQKRDAVITERFYFRKSLSASIKKNQCSSSVINGGDASNTTLTSTSDQRPCSESYLQELSIDEIINGHADKFTGLIPFILDYMDNIEIDVDTRCTVSRYLDLISKRASGKLQTTARYIRNFVANHPDYKKDSVVSQEINYDLMKRFDQISKGLIACPDFLPDGKSKSKSSIPKAVLAANSDQTKP
ncbi:gcs-1 [Bugula neritina]|uniref:Glutamate--cysteine ligase n=1 Tax=Bugula neritina TaxID=10212 RepID=A0A7J7K8B4_BUGNE|nr:gcs-1 [Bugula neritina]